VGQFIFYESSMVPVEWIY